MELIHATEASKKLESRLKEIDADFIKDFNKSIENAVFQGFNFVEIRHKLEKRHKSLLISNGYKVDENGDITTVIFPVKQN